MKLAVAAGTRPLKTGLTSSKRSFEIVREYQMRILAEQSTIRHKSARKYDGMPVRTQRLLCRKPPDSPQDSLRFSLQELLHLKEFTKNVRTATESTAHPIR
jgi:hypothetical protein